MNGLDASQGNYALADGSVVQGTGVDLSSAIQAPHSDGGGVLTEKTLLYCDPILPDNLGEPHRPNNIWLFVKLPRK